MAAARGAVRLAMGMCLLGLASAQTPPSPPASREQYNWSMSADDQAYQIGLWASIVLFFVLIKVIAQVGSIDYSNDILIISNPKLYEEGAQD